MSDIFSNFNEHVSENAGLYGALAGVSHSRNQARMLEEARKQKELQLELIQKQEEANRIESKRLEIENTRIKLEEQRAELERLDREEKKILANRVKSIRQTIASINQSLDNIEQQYS